MVTLADLRTFAKYHLVRRVVDHPAPETELGIAPLDYDPDAYVAQIRSYAERSFDVSTLDEVAYRDRRFPILAVRRAHRDARKRLLVLAGVHGNEHAGLLAVPEILDAFDEAALPIELCVVTPVNPVGAAYFSRYNALGFDINRDFSRFETPEARAVRRVADRMRPDFLVALHEGPQDATFLFTNRCVPDDLSMRVLRVMSDAGTVLAARDYFGRTLDPPGHAPMSRSMWLLCALWAHTLSMMATSMWANERGLPEITLESSWRHPDRSVRVRGHTALVMAVARELATAA